MKGAQHEALPQPRNPVGGGCEPGSSSHGGPGFPTAVGTSPWPHRSESSRSGRAHSSLPPGQGGCVVMVASASLLGGQRPRSGFGLTLLLRMEPVKPRREPGASPHGRTENPGNRERLGGLPGGGCFFQAGLGDSLILPPLQATATLPLLTPSGYRPLPSIHPASSSATAPPSPTPCSFGKVSKSP